MTDHPDAPRDDNLPGRAARLEISDLTVRFGGVRAVDGLTFSHARGGVLGLIGPNGAGKTTVVNVMSGAVRPTSGAVTLNGRRISGRRPDRISRAGVARTFQNLATFTSLSALENVLVALEAKAAAKPVTGLVAPVLQRKNLRSHARELLDRVGMSGHADTLVDSLPYGARRRVEVARALATQPRLVMLDEPLAGLSRAESDDLANVIRSVAESGVTVLLVEHDMVAVMRISDWVAVLDRGQLLAEGEPSDIQSDERVRIAYLGEELGHDPVLHKGRDAHGDGAADHEEESAGNGTSRPDGEEAP
ncbi:MAG: ABC transporter ATP-binding protein [Micromonosporaceae bacterium]